MAPAKCLSLVMTLVLYELSDMSAIVSTGIKIETFMIIVLLFSS